MACSLNMSSLRLEVLVRTKKKGKEEIRNNKEEKNKNRRRKSANGIQNCDDKYKG